MGTTTTPSTAPQRRPARPQSERFGLSGVIDIKPGKCRHVINNAEAGIEFSPSARSEKPKTDRPDGCYSHRARRAARAGAGNRRMEAQPSSASQVSFLSSSFELLGSPTRGGVVRPELHQRPRRRQTAVRSNS